MMSAKKASITDKTFIWDCVNPFKFLLGRRPLDMFQPVANERDTTLDIVSSVCLNHAIEGCSGGIYRVSFVPLCGE